MVVTVARADPMTPQWNTKMKRGLSSEFTPAENSMVAMEIMGFPSALIVLFNPKESI
ncbi:hypothetical protein SDC9_201663 [bioreactor metagenome]|uniref:Uncharacterized protein n=1 Tax=bioreactor metagenome TaxID=1076179 RepID=A0A645J0G3_9ZZZZ